MYAPLYPPPVEISRLPTGPNRDRLQAVVAAALAKEDHPKAPGPADEPPPLVMEHQCQADFNALCQALVTPGVTVWDMELLRGSGFLDPSGLAAALQYSQGLRRLR